MGLLDEAAKGSLLDQAAAEYEKPVSLLDQAVLANRPGVSMPKIEMKERPLTPILKEAVADIPKRFTIPVVSTAAGAAIGSAVGGVGAAPGAAVGAGVGEWLQMMYEKYVLSEPDQNLKEKALRTITAMAGGYLGPELAAAKNPQAAKLLDMQSPATKVGAKLEGKAPRDETAVKLLPAPKVELGIPASPGTNMKVSSGVTEKVWPGAKNTPVEPSPGLFTSKGGDVRNSKISFDQPGATVNPSKNLSSVEEGVVREGITPPEYDPFKEVVPNIEEAAPSSGPGVMFPSEATQKLNQKVPTIEEQATDLVNDLNSKTPAKKVPSDVQATLMYIRPLDEAINKAGYGNITEPIYKATAVGDGFVEEFTQRARVITKGMSPEQQAALIRVREGRGTTADWAIPGMVEKNSQLRQWFDDLFKVVDDPELKASLEKDGWRYIEGYVPMLKNQYSKVAEKGASGADEMLKATERAAGAKHDLTAQGFISRNLRRRRGELPDYERELDLNKLMTIYLQGIKKTAFDIPAYQEAMGVVKSLPKGEFQNQASWYLNNWIGQPSVIRDSVGYNTAKWVRNRMYSALIGLKAPVAALNLSQVFPTFIETGGSATLKGLGKALTPSGQKAAKGAGYFREYPGAEGSIKSTVDQIANSLMSGAERINRATSREAGLDVAKKMGLEGAKAAEKGTRQEFMEKFANPQAMKAWDVTRKTQFMYGKESPVRWATNHPLLSMFSSYPTKMGEYTHTVIKDAITKGGAENWSKVARMIAVTSAAGGIGAGLGVIPTIINSLSSVTTGVPIFKLSSKLVSEIDGVIKGEKGAAEAFGETFKTLWRYGMPAGDATVRALEEKKKKKSGIIEPVKREDE